MHTNTVGALARTLFPASVTWSREPDFLKGVRTAGKVPSSTGRRGTRRRSNYYSRASAPRGVATSALAVRNSVPVAAALTFRAG